jgi:hypothetical protein
MADIFVSYAKTDRSLASTLVAMLEAEGWSVWWDTSLGAADLYRDEIMKQLALARAVIAIWTPNSIRSDWVRAEAGTAKKEGKLIPVKTADVAYGDIPLPFGEMHTENLEASQLIRAAVVAQLAKPAVEPSAAALLTKGFKYELLTWVGIVGGALTLFGNLDAALKLADWARLLVDHWKEWTHAFWLWAFGWLGIHLPPEWTPVLSFLLFWSMLTVGQIIKGKSTIKNQPSVDIEPWPWSWRQALYLGFCLIGIIWVSRNSSDLFESLFRYLSIAGTGKESINLRDFAIVVGFMCVALIFIALYARQKLHAAVATCLMVIFWIIITFNQLATMKPSEPDEGIIISLIAMIMLLILTQILLSVASAKAVSRRLIFLAIGLVLLIALNEISKFGLDVTAPKQG